MKASAVSRRRFLQVAGLAGSACALAACSNAGTQETAGSLGTIEDKPETGAGTESKEPQQSAGSAQATEEAKPEEESKPAAKQTTAEKLLGSMTLEQKVAQLFFVTPEILTGVDPVDAAGEITKNALANMPVGGLIYFSQNIIGADQLKTMLANTVGFSKEVGAGIPVFTGVDEEGGSLVARVANSGYFNVEKFPNMAKIGASGDASQAANVGTVIGNYLHEIGFSVDFAPDADVLTNPNNTVIGARSFSSDPAVVSDMVGAEVEAMLKTGTLPCAKHWPGHGDTAGDSHTGEAISYRTADQLHECEYHPFYAANAAHVPMIMVGHIKTPNAAGDDLPATLSHIMISEALRGIVGFNGVVVSDSMRMGAITQYYSQADAAVKFLQAGGDMLLMPDDLYGMYNGVIDAVHNGTLTEDRINESVSRIIAAKQAAGLVAE